MSSNPDFDVALSFAGEDRAYVDRVACALRASGVRVFYDRFEEIDLWGKDLYVHLSEVYSTRARFTVMFISAWYATKLWTNHERASAQERAFREQKEYILPARFDDTSIPGVRETIGYISLKDRTPEDFAELVAKKIGIRRESASSSAVGALPGSSGDRKGDTDVSDTSHSLSVLVVDQSGVPIAGATVIAQAENGTYVECDTGYDGTYSISARVDRPYCLLVAHPSFDAAIVLRVIRATPVIVTLVDSDSVGSTVILSSGHIPGLVGRINPILDAHGRRYMYADNIAIDGGKVQPVPFELGTPIHLEDAHGTVVLATIKYIAGRVALLQYERR